MPEWKWDCLGVGDIITAGDRGDLGVLGSGGRGSVGGSVGGAALAGLASPRVRARARVGLVGESGLFRGKPGEEFVVPRVKAAGGPLRCFDLPFDIGGLEAKEGLREGVIDGEAKEDEMVPEGLAGAVLKEDIDDEVAS